MDESKENRNAQKRAPRQSKEDTCGRCGKTPKTKTSEAKTTPSRYQATTPDTMPPPHNYQDNTTGKPLSISLIRTEKSSSKKGKRKRCKHKDELAKYTNVSGSTTTCSNYSNSVAESTAVTDSDQSCASTLTQLTQRSVRSIKREKNADKEIARLNDINNQLTDQLDLLSKGTNLQEMFDKMKTPVKSHLENTSQPLDDNTLTPDGDPANISMATQDSPKSVPQLRPYRLDSTPSRGSTPRNPTTPRETLSSARSRGFTPHSFNEDSAILETLYEVKTPASHSKKSEETATDSAYQTQVSLRASKELLTELEEENAELRAELKGSISNSKRMLALEKEIRELVAENFRCRQEIARLGDVDLKLRQVEEFYHEEKKTFRCTIEDTLLALEDFRKDKEDLEQEIEQLQETIKDADDKNSNIKEEMKEQNNLLTNSVEKLKLELETGQAENAMLQSRITTVEENCCFLEGQVKALEKDSSEKTQIIVAAEQHARDLETEIGEFRRDKMALETENLKIGQLGLQLETLEGTIRASGGENSELKTKLKSSKDESSKMEVRLSELVKSHTLLEETLEEKNRGIISLQNEIKSVKSDAQTLTVSYKEANEDRLKLQKESSDQCDKTKKLSNQIDLLQCEIQFIEEAFFKGWSDEESSVTFEDEKVTPQYPQANKIIQTIKLDRQKLKAKLVRSVQDNKTLHAQLEELHDALEQDNSSFSRKLSEAMDRLSESDVKTRTLERKAKNLAIQVEELSVVNQSLEQENYHLKKLSDTLAST